jgi:hypothetical protein
MHSSSANISGSSANVPEQKPIGGKSAGESRDELKEAHNIDALAPNHRLKNAIRFLNVPVCISASLLLFYTYAFVASLRGRWFHPLWTTDDATQQTFPLFDALYPGRFSDDLISEVMRGCLPPVHYWLSFITTVATRDPIMTGHCIMLVQVGLAVAFLFMAVRRFSNNAIVPGLLSVLWLLHSRNTMQRMTGGLPRGWTPAIFSAFLYFAATRNHWGCLSVILLGSMLNPPGALIVGVAYGFLLLWRCVSSEGEERRRAQKVLLQSIALVPLFVFVALLVVQRPAHIGQMVSFAEASKMPEFQKPFGRFPFLPLRSVVAEYKIFGLQAFIGRLYRPPMFLREIMWWAVPSSLLLIVGLGALRKRVVIPAELVVFGLAASCTYSVSRLIAFRLFVPDRHLQIPMVIFLIGAFCVGIWRLFVKGNCLESSESFEKREKKESLRNCWAAMLGFFALGSVVYLCSGSGLKGDANFNYYFYKRGKMYEWLRDNTPTDSLIACHPTHCDGMQLFAVRRALVTTETSHPFYPRYNLEMRRRSELSLRAHYATSLEELVTLLAPEGVTHFVFRREDFRPEKLSKATYFPPLDTVVKELTSRDNEQLLFYSLPRKGLDKETYPFVVFVDKTSIIVDIKALTSYLRSRGWTPPQEPIRASMDRHRERRGGYPVIVAKMLKDRKLPS